MYNSELKERFLCAFTNSENVRNVYRLIFRQTERTEEDLGKDVYMMAPDDRGCREMATSLVSLRGESRDKRLYLLKQYVRWCVKEGIPGASEAFLEVQPSWFVRIREKMVGSSVDMLRHLNEAFEKPDAKTIDIVFRCFLWLGFMGLDEDDAVSLKRSDVDIGARTVIVETETERKTYPIPGEAVTDFALCRSLDFFFRYSASYLAPAPIQRVASSQLLRGLRSETTRNYLANSISARQKKKREENPKVRILSYTSARISGHFSRMYEMERAGVSPDFSTIVSLEIDRAEEKRDGTKPATPRPQREYAKKKAYSADYKYWKYVFGI